MWQPATAAKAYDGEAEGCVFVSFFCKKKKNKALNEVLCWYQYHVERYSALHV